MIEGPLSQHDMVTAGGKPVRAIECALIKASLRDGIYVVRVPDAKTLASTVLYLFRSLDAGELDGDSAAQRRAAAGYADTVHVKKSKNDDAGLTWRMMLATLRGVSMEKATALAQEWSGPAALARAIEGRPYKEAVKRVAATEVGKERRLGPALAKRLVEVFSL
jgi:hypothetical protein